MLCVEVPDLTPWLLSHVFEQTNPARGSREDTAYLWMEPSFHLGKELHVTHARRGWRVLSEETCRCWLFYDITANKNSHQHSSVFI